VSCSVCIATYKRPRELAACLDALRQQSEPPDEIVVSDAGGDTETREVVASHRRRQESLIVHCPTPRAALPWQRWWGLQHCGGTFVLFLDDDIRLAPQALALLRQAYDQGTDVAGAGFAITYERSNDARPVAGNTDGWRTRWLGIVGARPGSITPGGITIDLPIAASDSPIVEVEWLSGGAMSFRRDVLTSIGALNGLFELYDRRIGKAEDSILSHRARAEGRLLLIGGPHAVHPPLDRATRTANPQDGYRKGLLETWGRAHVLRWLADDPSHASRAWRRIATLEIARAGKAAVRHPMHAEHWQRLAGDAVGIARTVREWDRLPERPDQPSDVTTLMFFWDYDTQWGADRSRQAGRRDWGHLDFRYTDDLLDWHAQFAIPACFAVVGAAALPGARPYHDPAQIRRIHAAGHEVASHAFEHEWLPALDRQALLRTLRDSKDALEQCIGAPVVSFVPPFNQPFDYAAAGSFSLSERREAGARRTTLRGLCDALAETGYRFCRVAYVPLGERVGRWLGHAPLRPAPPITISGITCVRIGPCGFDGAQLLARCRRATAGTPVVLYGHPHSLQIQDVAPQTTDADLQTRDPDLQAKSAKSVDRQRQSPPRVDQSAAAVRQVLAMTSLAARSGGLRCVLPSQLLTSAAPQDALAPMPSAS